MKRLALLLCLSGCGQGLHFETDEPFFIGVENNVNRLVQTECFKSSVPEAVYSKFLKYKEVKTKVAINGGAAEAIVCGDLITYSPHIRNLNDNNFAMTIVTIHEWAHLLCYDHPKDSADPQYEFSVPVTVAAVAKRCLMEERKHENQTKI